VSGEAPRAPVLEAKGLRKRYHDGAKARFVVDGVSMRVERGEWLVLSGPSGSGKTTLLGLLGGLVTPTEGDVLIAGRSVVHMRDHHRTRWRRRHVGFVFQELALVPGMSLLENVLLPLAPAGGASRAAVDRARALLDRLGILSLADTSVERLSGGERQRGSIARALVLDPEVLLMDEPTAHIDAAQVERLLALLAELRGEGRTLLTSTHDPRLADDPRVDAVIRIVGGRALPLDAPA
jgi:putative ABC transport system ATP-binding protein